MQLPYITFLRRVFSICLIWILILIWFLLFETPQFFNKFIFSTLQICSSYSKTYNISVSRKHITTIYSTPNVLTLIRRTCRGNTCRSGYPRIQGPWRTCSPRRRCSGQAAGYLVKFHQVRLVFSWFFLAFCLYCINFGLFLWCRKSVDFEKSAANKVPIKSVK